MTCCTLVPPRGQNVYLGSPKDKKSIKSNKIELKPDEIGDLLDIGTGTGRMLVLYGTQAIRAIGIDLSREMLSVARVNLEQAGLRNCQVRLGDMYQLPVASESFDSVTIHQVLHYAASAITSPGESA